MKACVNCGLCYAAPNKEEYRCMRGARKPISDMFVLSRIRCDKYVEVDMTIKVGV